MKEPEEITCCVLDYGTFISLAEALAQTYAKVYYYSPYEQEFQGVKTCVVGDGLERITRLDEFMDPDVLKTIDLFCCPDIGFGGLQRYLRSIGKLVWGSMGADELELYRTRFLKVLKELGLPVVNYVKVVGVTALADHLKTVKNKWVKVNRFRDDMETWHHIDYPHSIPMLDGLALKFGGVKELVTFVVQDNIPNAREIGYDGLNIDGDFPDQCFAGYEKKNELYLGSLGSNASLPEPVKEVNEAMAPLLRQYGYRNFFATELRKTEDTTHFIDPTMRLAGQTMEHQFQTCKNLATVILKGAAGELVRPEYTHDYAAEATLHYTAGEKEDWKVLLVPEQAKPWTKLCGYCQTPDGYLHFPPKRGDVGVVCGVGDTVQESIEALRDNFELLKDEPVSIRFEGFADLLRDIEKAEAEGMGFTDKALPPPEIAIQQGS